LVLDRLLPRHDVTELIFTYSSVLVRLHAELLVAHLLVVLGHIRGLAPQSKHILKVISLHCGVGGCLLRTPG